MATSTIEAVNTYETVFILTPVLNDQQREEVLAKFQKTLKDGKAKITHQEDWGMKKLAYPIGKKTTGFYYLIEFEAPTSLIDTLETEYRRDETVIRFLTVRLDKYAKEYAERRRKKGFGKSKPAPAAETAA